VCATCSDEAFEGIVRRLRAARSLLVLTHARPDGDGLGTMAALAAAGRAAGKRVELLVPDRIPDRYQFLFAAAAPAAGKRFADLADAADVVLVVDTCALAQLDGLQGALPARREKIAVLDHHATADDVGAVQWIDTSAAAVGVMAGELIDALGWPVSRVAAEALMTAVTTDTGWLRFANTDGRALRAVARWTDAGVRPDALFRRLYQADRPERLRLCARMLDGLELSCGGRLAAMTVRREDFAATGARPEETENLINEALRLETVEAAVLLVENADGVRVSLRSRDRVDVAQVARRFGGGGHARAAGARTAEQIDQLKQRLLAALAAELARAGEADGA
jgi:phosphoesterase RecJ-like protein